MANTPVPTATLASTYKSALGAFSSVANTATSVFTSVNQTVGMASSFVDQASRNQQKNQITDAIVFDKELASKTTARLAIVHDSMLELTKNNPNQSEEISNNYNAILAKLEEMNA